MTEFFDRKAWNHYRQQPHSLSVPLTTNAPDGPSRIACQPDSVFYAMLTTVLVEGIRCPTHAAFIIELPVPDISALSTEIIEEASSPVIVPCTPGLDGEIFSDRREALVTLSPISISFGDGCW
ncbi:hypothetical protein FRB91_008194 [Serendipita sp. 411]|nr:hypothetical protein FRB91_008194 [Serendipita sp. 411]